MCRTHSAGMSSGTELPLAPVAGMAVSEPAGLWAVVHAMLTGASPGRQTEQ